MNFALSLPRLADRYEIKARLIPALLSCSVAIPSIASLISLGMPNWIANIPAGGAVFAVLAVGLSYGSSLAGRKYEAKLWPRWPYDAPTNVWLQPDNSLRSTVQKRIWYGAIERLTGLDIAQAAVGDDKQNLESVINDAVVALRPQFRAARHLEEGRQLAIHNENYGLVRNLTGLRPIWFTASIISAIVSWASYFALGTWLGWGILAAIVLALVILLFFNLPMYVRQCADRYAEGFFGVLMALDRLNSTNEE